MEKCLWIARYEIESLDGKVKRFERSGLTKIWLRNPYALQKHEYNFGMLMWIESHMCQIVQ
jgi:hypothetical protein